MHEHEVWMCNASAQRLGVQPGLRRVTAQALAPQLLMGVVDPARDRQVLTRVAHVALAFTPAVCLAPEGDADSHTVLLEVQASLRCFGGWAALLQRLRTALALLDCSVQLASAPTARGAAVLSCYARSGELHASDLAELDSMLEAVPLGLLQAGRAQWDVLERMGLGTFGDLRRLPRRALLRRVGPGLLDEVDVVLGVRHEPAPAWITWPDVFDARLELQTRADSTDQLLHGARLLIESLLAWARAQQARVRRYTLFMHHERRHWGRGADGGPDASPATALSIVLAEASCDAEHLSMLLRERLAPLSLPAPTLELQLHCADVVRGSASSVELFTSVRVEREGWTRLIERLQARLGVEHVQQLQLMAHHLPERGVLSQAVSAEAMARASSGARRAVPTRSATSGHGHGLVRSAAAPRPVWLLSEPQRLHERQSRPLLDGQPLQLLCGPERIEAGWWEEPSSGRDYFIAQTTDGALVWLYRTRLPLSVPDDAQGWFMHGHFG